MLLLLFVVRFDSDSLLMFEDDDDDGGGCESGPSVTVFDFVETCDRSEVVEAEEGSGVDVVAVVEDVTFVVAAASVTSDMDANLDA